MPQPYEILVVALDDNGESVEVKFCSGPSHPDGAYVVVEGFGVRGKGAKREEHAGRLKGECKACEAERTRNRRVQNGGRRSRDVESARRARSVTHVRVRYVWWVFEELALRVGLLTTCACVGISINQFYSWRKGKHYRMKKDTAAMAMRLLAEVRGIQRVSKEEAYRLRRQFDQERRKQTLGLVQGEDGRWYKETNMTGFQGKPTLMVEDSLALSIHEARAPIKWQETPYRPSSVVDTRDLRDTEEMTFDRELTRKLRSKGTDSYTDGGSANGRAEAALESLTSIHAVAGRAGEREERLRSLLVYQRRVAQAREDLARARAHDADQDHSGSG